MVTVPARVPWHHAPTIVPVAITVPVQPRCRVIVPAIILPDITIGQHLRVPLAMTTASIIMCPSSAIITAQCPLPAGTITAEAPCSAPYSALHSAQQ